MLISDTDTAFYPHLLYKPSVWAASQMEAVLKGLLALTKNKVQELNKGWTMNWVAIMEIIVKSESKQQSETTLVGKRMKLSS